MILRSQQAFDKVMLERENPQDFIDFISCGIKKELVNQFIDKLSDHKIYVVKLSEPGLIEDLSEPWSAAYRQDLECLPVVQCKECRMAYPWCQKFRDELGGNGFCPYGAEIITEVGND